MPPSTWAIINPAAGSVDDTETVRTWLVDIGGVHSRVTSSPGDATRFASEARLARIDRVIAVGGDGTISEVVAGLADLDAHADSHQPALAVVPMGTGNDLARSLGLFGPLWDVLDAIATHRTRPMDLIRVRSGDQQLYCANAITAGFAGKVREHATEELKGSWGPLAYLRAAAEALGEFEPFQLTLETKDAEPVSLSAANLIIGNGRFAAAGLPVAPHAMLDDGLLDLHVIPAGPVAQLAMLAAQVVLGTHPDDPGVLTRRVPSLTVRAAPAMPYSIDGEPLTSAVVHLDVCRHALRVVIGPDAPALSDAERP